MNIMTCECVACQITRIFIEHCSIDTGGDERALSGDDVARLSAEVLGRLVSLTDDAMERVTLINAIADAQNAVSDQFAGDMKPPREGESKH